MATPTGSVQRVGIRVGNSGKQLTAANIVTIAQQYDWLFGVAGTLVGGFYVGLTVGNAVTIRAANPTILLIFHEGTASIVIQGSTALPDAYYYPDKTTGNKVKEGSTNYYIVDVANATARANRVSASAARPDLDGVFTDRSMPHVFFSATTWKDAVTGLNANFGGDDLPGAALPNGILAYHTDLRTAVGASKPRYYNNIGGVGVFNEYLADNQACLAVSGAMDENWGWNGSGAPRSESDWKAELDRIGTQTTAGNDTMVGNALGSVAPPAPYTNAQAQKMMFGSYLLVADGIHALYQTKDNVYDGSYLTLDFGSPDLSVNGGAYQTFGTAGSTAIYKRTFTKYRVWVNPGTNQRTQDGKTIEAKTALFEVRSDPPSLPGAPSLTWGTPTATTLRATVTAGSPAGDTYEVRYRRDVDAFPASPQIVGLAAGSPYDVGSGGQGEAALESDRTYFAEPYGRNAQGLGSAGTVQQATTSSVVLPPPSSYSLVNPTLDSLTAQWSAVAGATSYKIQYRNQGDGWPGSPQLTGLTGTSYVITGLTAGVKEAQILTTNGAGDGAWSSTATGTIPAPPSVPAEPSSPTIVALDFRTLRLTCTDNATNEDGFKWRVNRQDTGGGVFTQIGTTATGVVTLDYPDPAPGIGGHTYQMEVAAYNGVGDSAYVKSGTVTTPEQAPVPPVTFPSSPTFAGSPGFPSSPTFPS